MPKGVIDADKLKALALLLLLIQVNGAPFCLRAIDGRHYYAGVLTISSA